MQRSATSAGSLDQVLTGQLGPNWWRGKDVIFTAVGDAHGMHYYIARESEGYYWRPLASILPAGTDASDWTGYFCVSGDSRYMLATVFPTLADNNQRLEDRGALAYVIDVRDGRVRPLVAGVAMYYDTPGCGTGDIGGLSSFPGSEEERTDLLTVDLGSARVTRIRQIAGQVTSAVPTATGIDGYLAGSIVSIGPTGARTLASVDGAAYDLRVTASGGLNYLTTDFGSTATAWYLPAGSDAKPAAVGTGARDGLRLFAGASGHNVLTGAANVRRLPRMADLRVAGSAVGAPADRTSQTGAVVERLTAGHGATVIPELVVAATGRALIRPLPASVNSTSAMPPMLSAGHEQPAANTKNPVCAVPRLDPRRQVLQPTRQQVEWAVDLAVHNALTVARPADYANMGLPAYSPDNDIPAPALAGGGTIPPQIMLGVLAQESNFDQASFHALPGIAGDPLIADYYGARGGIDSINYNLADCGYGIGQITTGMTIGSKFWGSAAAQAKIAVDYAEDIAASVSLLSAKWNQLHGYAEPIVANGGNSKFVENWYMALWAYNTGLDPNSLTGNTRGCVPGPSCTDAKNNGPGGHWGLGWTNNPENTDWNPSRQPFLLRTYADAAHPGDWPYQEKVLGWAARPIRDYKGAASYTPTSAYPNVAPFKTFCTAADNCRLGTRKHCTLANFHCWWHHRASWTSCNVPRGCRQGIAVFSPGSSEPATSSPHAPDCSSALPSNAVIVDDQAINYNLVGCVPSNWTSQGMFSLTQGKNRAGVPISVIDTHQLGAGFGGHLYFTHNIARGDKEHLVTGRWSVSLPTGAYHVLVHIPSTGGTTTSATYHVTAANGTVFASTINQFQEQNEWVGLGYFTLGDNATVTLDNVTSDGALKAHDVAYDAVAFVPVTGRAVNHTFEAVSLFDWNQNLNTHVPHQVDTPTRTMKTLHDWALDYAYKGLLWSNPKAGLVRGVSSFPKCRGLTAITAKCVPRDVWNVGANWAAKVKAAGTAPSKSKKPVMTEPTWLNFSNPTPGPVLLKPSSYSSDTSFKVKTLIKVSFVVSNGRISPGSDQVTVSVATGTTELASYLVGLMRAAQKDYGIKPPDLNYDEVDANAFSGDATPEHPLSTGLAPGREYVWHADPASISGDGTCVVAHTIMGGMIGYRPLAAQTPVAASVTAWVKALQNDKKVNKAVSAMAVQLNQFYFSQKLLGGTLFLHAPPIWQDAHIQVCADGSISSAAFQPNIDDKPQRTLVDQSYMPDLYLYYDGRLVNDLGKPTSTPVQRGNFVNFSNISGVTAVVGTPFGVCDTTETGNAGNPWAMGLLRPPPNAVPASGQSCSNIGEFFGSPFPGG